MIKKSQINLSNVGWAMPTIELIVNSTRLGIGIERQRENRASALETLSATISSPFLKDRAIDEQQTLLSQLIKGLRLLNLHLIHRRRT